MTPRELAEKICRTLHEAGHQAYLVGGCVRDLLLGREPADYDVATDARPDRLQELFPGCLLVGARFGVIVVVEQGVQVEVATFRSDLGYSDGRHPDRVVYAESPREDVLRRDFTINGLLLDVRTGEVLDFVGGRQDLQSGVIRAIGDPERRFAEDHLRMVRAVRFAARFRFVIEPATFAAIRKLAPAAAGVSAERLREELTRLLTEGAARRAFELLDETGLLHVLLPEVARMKGVEQPPQFHPEGDVWVHTLLMLEHLPAGCSPTLAWGVLLHDVGKPPTFTPPAGPGDRIRFDQHAEVGARMAAEICRRFRFSNDDTEQIVALVAHHLRFKDVQRMRPATLKRFVRMPGFAEHLELHRLDCLASHRMLDNYEFVRDFLQSTPPEQVRPARLISGEDLKQMGYPPGPRFREILRAVEDAQLEGQLDTREAALEFVRRTFPADSPAQ
ncbi:MAG: CCA tRNA nucleotidyltransferase [Acidobacteriia bacterium]|jgi:poly(A) polymerase|nr:CCA tRNA nucleotidyltransferase [Terriglobia bacterium]